MADGDRCNEEQTSIPAVHLWLASAAIALSIIGVAQAQEDQRFVLRLTVAPELDTTVMSSRPLAYREDEEPAWMPRVLDKLQAAKPRSFALQQRVLFRRGGEPSFLALIWNQSTLERLHFELYQVDVISPGNVRLTYRRSLQAPHLAVVEPSGRGVHGDNVPILYLAASAKSRSFAEETLHVIRLDRASIRLMAREPVRSVRVMDLDREGRYTLIASDDRWSGLFETCPTCGPLVPTLYSWRDGAYRPDCRWYPDYYEQRNKTLEERLAAPQELSLPGYLDLRVEIVLSLLQAGRIDNARKEFDDMLDDLRGPLADRWATEAVERNLALAEAAFVPVIAAAAAAANADEACPVLGYEGAPAKLETDE